MARHGCKESSWIHSVQVVLYSNLRRRLRTLHLFFPSSFLLQYGKRTLFRYSAFTGPHVAGEYLANDAVSDLKFTVVIPEDLPVPPVQQVDNLVCLIRIIQKIINALIEPF